MSTERQLNDAMIEHDRWREAADEAISFGWELEAQTDEYGEQLALEASKSKDALRELRQGVRYASALDAEVVAAGVGSIDNLSGADYREAAARRIAHHAGRHALNLLRSAARRDVYRANRGRQVRERRTFAHNDGNNHAYLLS